MGNSTSAHKSLESSLSESEEEEKREMVCDTAFGKPETGESSTTTVSTLDTHA